VVRGHNPDAQGPAGLRHQVAVDRRATDLVSKPMNSLVASIKSVPGTALKSATWGTHPHPQNPSLDGRGVGL
jgi:hypothetical protein